VVPGAGEAVQQDDWLAAAGAEQSGAYLGHGRHLTPPLNVEVHPSGRTVLSA
jgi:hypothetical protein